MSTTVTSAVANIWSEDTTDITGNEFRRSVPAIPKITRDVQVVFGAKDVLIYMMHQIEKTTDKQLVMRAIASATTCIFGDSLNYTGSAKECDAIWGLDLPDDISTAEGKTRLIASNFEDAEPVTFGEFDEFATVDADELAAYFGVLYLAMVKRVTPENRTAFNDKRSSAVKAQVIDDLQIFTQNSKFLSDRVLHKVYASANSFQPYKAHMVSMSAAKMSPSLLGPQTAFSVMFLLLVDAGMGALRIIKEATLKYPIIMTEFPELAPEFQLAHKAQTALRRAPQNQRSFVKAIHGANFVPLPYQETNNLTGVCKEFLIETTPTYRNYGGGMVTPAQQDKIRRLVAAMHSEKKPSVPTTDDE